MTLIRQRAKTFIRIYDAALGFIVEQASKRTDVFEEAGVGYLAHLSRTPQPLEMLTENIAGQMGGLATAQRQKDFSEFIEYLESARYVVTGLDQGELERKDRSYALETDHPKDSACLAGGRIPGSAEQVLMQYFRKRPHILGGQIDLTSRCNQACRHCYLPPGRATMDLDLSLAMDVLDQLGEQGALAITFSGGEPFLYPHLAEVLRHARRRDVVIILQSNGSRVTDDNLALLKEVELNQIQISLFSMDAAVHDAITGVKNSHAKALSAIERLKDAGFHVRIGCHITKLNRDSYRSIIPWARDRSIKLFTDFLTIPTVDFRQTNLAIDLPAADKESLLREQLAFSVDDYKTVVPRNMIPGREDALDSPVCTLCWQAICLAANGDYYPCSSFLGYTLGNALRDRLADVWQKSRGLARLRALTWNDFPKCQGCDARRFCAMCPAKNFNGSGDILIPLGQTCDSAFLVRRFFEERRAIWDRIMMDQGTARG